MLYEVITINSAQKTDPKIYSFKFLLVVPTKPKIIAIVIIPVHGSSIKKVTFETDIELSKRNTSLNNIFNSKRNNFV